MTSSTEILCILLALFGLANTCDFQLSVRSETEHEVWAQFTFFNKSLSEPIVFEKYGQTHVLHVVGGICNLQPTILKTYQSKPNGESKPFGETSAFLEGVGGVMNYQVHYKKAPQAVGSEMMICSWGSCRG